MTFFATKYANFGVPQVVELHVTEIVARNDDADRVEKTVKRKAMMAARYQAQKAKHDLEVAEKKKADAEAEIARLRGKT